MEDLARIGASREGDGFSPLVNVVLSGEVGRLSGELKRMRDLSLNPVGLLLAMERRVAQLAQLSAKLGPGGDVAGLLEAETRARRVFFKDKRDLAPQRGQWSGRKLGGVGRSLGALHQALVSGSHSAEVVLAQGLTDIARAAARRR